MDELEMANAAGWHTDDGQNIHGVVGVKVWLNNGGSIDQGPYSVSNTTSHEVLEMFFNKNVNAWRDSGRGWSMIKEVCDPVQGYHYNVNGVSVSDFVLPEYFDMTPPPGSKFDYLNRITEEFTIGQGGYCIYFQNGQELEFFAQEVPEWLKEVKHNSAARFKWVGEKRSA
jgi:hypothetical protein